MYLLASRHTVRNLSERSGSCTPFPYLKAPLVNSDLRPLNHPLAKTLFDSLLPFDPSVGASWQSMQRIAGEFHEMPGLCLERGTAAETIHPTGDPRNNAINSSCP